MKKYLSLIIWLICSLPLLSCKDSSPANDGGNNCVYYWRTTFSLSDAEKEFLKEHDVKKMYLRFFDVDYEYSNNGECVVPEATVQFRDSIPYGIEVVPTVYITMAAVIDMQMTEDGYAERILKRVNAICRKYNIAFKEIQLDCDWNKSTREPFFRLCEAVKQGLDSAQMLSSTIRLHQLTQTPPPVDRGVLMVYNTGNLMEMTTENSIFSLKDIAPYLRDNRLSKYRLPLDVAYPAYGWSLVFRPEDMSHPEDGKYVFDRIMRRTDIPNYPNLKKIGCNLYEATSEVDFSQGGENWWDRVYENFRIKTERPTAEEILKVKELIDAQLSGKPHDNIIYHLDEEQLSHYSNNEISEIYTRN